jgi:hypothetical protein
LFYSRRDLSRRPRQCFPEALLVVVAAGRDDPPGAEQPGHLHREPPGDAGGAPHERCLVRHESGGGLDGHAGDCRAQHGRGRRIDILRDRHVRAFG